MTNLKTFGQKLSNSIKLESADWEDFLDELADNNPVMIKRWVCNNFECIGQDVATGEYELEWK